MKLAIRISETQPGKFKASCPSLPGCVAYGETRADAREKLGGAVTGYLASLNNDYLPASPTSMLRP